MLEAEIQAEILSLYFARGFKIRAIARKLLVNRKSVERVVKRKSVALQIEKSRRPSVLDPYQEKIMEMLSKDITLSSTVIFQRLRDSGYTGGYTIVREWVPGAKLRLDSSRPKEAFLKIEFAPGEAAQVDWGEFGDAFHDGVKIHCFVMVLCYSRLLYIEFTRSERFEDFIRCHENAFRYFEGRLPQTLWYDNLPTAVSERMGPLVRFNARFLAYCGHHHFLPHACNKARGNEKGRVEDGVKYVRSNFWPGRSFKDFFDLLAQANRWRDETANLREHQASRKVPRFAFDAEKDHLRPMNAEAYDTDEVFSKEVRPDYHFLFETNQYSVPWTLVGLVVTARVDAHEIRIYYRDRFVTKHSRSYLKYQKPFTNPEHEKGLLEIKPRGKDSRFWQLAALESYGAAVKDYMKCLRHSPRSLRQEISRLLALATIYGEDSLNEAVSEMLKRGVIGVEKIEQWLKNKNQNETPKPAPLTFQRQPSLERIPSRVDLRSYDALLFQNPDLLNSDEKEPL